MVTVAVGAYTCNHAVDSSVAQFSQENLRSCECYACLVLHLGVLVCALVFGFM